MTVHVRSIGLVYYVFGMHMLGICEIISTNISKIAIHENITLKNLVLYCMLLPFTNCSYQKNIFCAGLERVDDTTVLGKLDRHGGLLKENN